MTRSRARSRSGRFWPVGPLLGALVLATLAWCGGLIWFASDLDEPSPAPDRVTDAIVVLTGGAGRLDRGLELLHRGRARWLFISGVNPGIDAAKLLGPAEPAWQRCCVVLGYQAGNTAENGAETAAWVRRAGVRSLRLVTANYHMRRSLLELRRALPPGTEIVPEPVFADAARAEPWWRGRVAEHVVVSEYLKFLWAWIRPSLVRNPLPGSGE